MTPDKRILVAESCPGKDSEKQGIPMENVWVLASVWEGLALIATLVAIWFKISTALSEIVVGTVAQLIIGAFLVHGELGAKTGWITFLAGTGAIVLTFLAGTELDPEIFRMKWKEATVVGLVGGTRIQLRKPRSHHSIGGYSDVSKVPVRGPHQDFAVVHRLSHGRRSVPVTSGSDSLNSNHARRLSVTCRHIDKLLAEMESALNVSASKLAFPQYAPDLSPAQRRVIEDYIRRIRAQLVRVLDGQGIERPPANIPVSRSLHSHLTFVDIAAEELKPEYMRGYGEIPRAAALELNGIASELQGLVGQVDQYLMSGSENLAERFARLEQSTDEVSLLKQLESVISEHGLVEFRSTLSMILDRLEDNSFEIATFGRVSSGKSSLLNAMLETDALPVGVTPITAVPTRLLYGESAAVHVWFANRQPERFDISRLPEFVAEQLNRGNEKHVTRIVVQLPSPRLQEGIAFVDTPGLGSLATRGAAETLAYLPRCDLGVVLIDAGSTLTPDDLQTIQILYDAAIPATVLLSKADLLSVGDRNCAIGYVKDHIKEELKLDLAVRAVSVMAASKDLLSQWFEEDIASLYSQRQDLRLRSIRRKVGALRHSVEMALRSRLRCKDQISPKRVEQLRVVEAELRLASGRLEEMKKIAQGVVNDLEYSTARHLRLAAATLIESWSKQGTTEEAAPAIVRNAIVGTVQEQTDSLRRRMDAMAHKLHETIRATGKVLEMEDIAGEQEFSSVVREPPRFDPGPLNIRLRRPFFLSLLGRNLSISLLTKRLAGMIGEQITRSLSAYHALLYDWFETTLSQIQRRFDAYANSYRAQVERLVGHSTSSAGQQVALQRDLEKLERVRPDQPVAP